MSKACTYGVNQLLATLEAELLFYGSATIRRTRQPCARTAFQERAGGRSSPLVMKGANRGRLKGFLVVYK